MSVKLTLILSGRTLERFEFNEFERLRIGRGEDCDVRIENLGVSRHHCEIVRQDGFIALRDLGSDNGTSVNGAKVTVHNLNSGDVITINKYTIEYQGPAPTLAAAAPTPQATGEGPQGAMTLQVEAGALARMGTGKLNRIRGHLIIEPDSSRSPKTVVLEKPLTLIGKDPEGDLVLEGWFCPRVVAVILRDELGFKLVDVSNRADAVQVNGVKRRDARLSDQDLVKIRGLTAKFMRGTPIGEDR
jgi:pSer/pThr/pTyr-binding forkhead associated (FHA) protein